MAPLNVVKLELDITGDKLDRTNSFTLVTIMMTKSLG